jgi:NAD(P)-dependent dehydrogenase (short-subunit alcohol dehydrogenase family)
VLLPPPDDDWQWSALVETLTAELLADVPDDDRFVAYRHGSRWRRSFAPVELSDDPDVWHDTGRYLILGADTEVGLMVGEALVDRGAQLVLVDHRGAGTSGGEDRLSALQARAPHRVTHLTTDLTDAVHVEAVVREAAVRLGRFDGVFHLPDERAAGMVAMKSAGDVLTTLDARVRSTLVLAAALRRIVGDDPPGFLLLGSSITGFVGGFGQLENCAVASFLDGFAQSRDVPARIVSALHWGQWCFDDWFEQQMAALPEVRADYEQIRLRYGIPRAEGLGRTRAALAAGLPSVLVSTRDFRDVLAEQLRLTAAGFAASVTRAAQAGEGSAWDPAAIWPDDEVAQQVATVWRDVLGVALLDPETDFYGVGGNSLFAIQVVARLREIFGPLPMSVIFEAPTVPALAAAIRKQRTDLLGDEEIAGMLNEIEALSPEQAEAWLANNHG